MFETVKKITPYQKSYRAGLLQAKAFRILKKQTNESLAPYNLNATDWGILGLLFDQSEGLSHKQIAFEMGVKAPYITRSITKLKRRDFTNFTHSEVDARIKIVKITPIGEEFVKKVEKSVMNTLQHTLEKAGKRNMLGYVLTLIAVVEKSGTDITETDLDHIEDV